MLSIVPICTLSIDQFAATGFPNESHSNCWVSVMPVYVSTGFCGLIESCDVFPPAPVTVVKLTPVLPAVPVVTSEPEPAPPAPTLELLLDALHPPMAAA